MQSMQDLLKHELGDLYFAEKQILKDLKRMIREASDPEMQQRLRQHEEETREQVRNIEQAFESMGMKPKAEKCAGILGISQEKKDFDDEDPAKPVLEAFNLGAGLRVEHYEIAGYRSAISLARSMGERQCVDLLRRNLEQEVAMAKFIEAASQKALRDAGMQAAAGEEGTRSRRGAGNGRSRGAAARGATGGANGGTRARNGGTAMRSAGRTTNAGARSMKGGAPGANSRARERPE